MTQEVKKFINQNWIGTTTFRSVRICIQGWPIDSLCGRLTNHGEASVRKSNRFTAQSEI